MKSTWCWAIMWPKPTSQADSEQVIRSARRGEKLWREWQAEQELRKASKFTRSMPVSYVSTLAMVVSTPPPLVCAPAFIAEMPGGQSVVLKIGHFVLIGGVTHVEI